MPSLKPALYAAIQSHIEAGNTVTDVNGLVRRLGERLHEAVDDVEIFDEVSVEGEIKVGDVFDWQPYGTRGWPKASDRVIVTRITYRGDSLQTTNDLCVDDALGEVFVWVTGRHCKQEVFNELPHFRSMCRRVE